MKYNNIPDLSFNAHREKKKKKGALNFLHLYSI